MENPLVSIIIPVYNGANFVAEAIESALAQTYINIEIIVVNDGSNDNGETEKAVLSFGDRVRYFAKSNGGVASALNLGIKEMKGDYFSWLSHDDLYQSSKIEKQVKAITADNDIILCSGSLMNENKTHIPYFGRKIEGTFTGVEVFKEFIKGYNLNGLGFLIPMSVFDKIGLFDESMRYLQDLDEWLRMLMYDYNFICQKEELVITRIHSKQSTNMISNLFDVDRCSLATKHISIISNSNFSYIKKEKLLLLYLKLFVKGSNTEGLNLVRCALSEIGISKVKMDLISLPYYLVGKFKRIYRNIYNTILKTRGART